MLRIARHGIALAALALFTSSAFAQIASYEGHKVAQIEIRTLDELRAIENLEPAPDFWTHGHGVGMVDVQFAPDAFAAFTAMETPYRVVIDDVQALVDAERARLAGANPEAPWYDEFKDLAEINVHIDELVAAHPNIASVQTIGQSYEGRDIRALRLSGPGAGTGKIGILLSGTQHAREWISPMTVMYIAESLMSSYGTDPRATSLLDNTEIFVIPVVNPDGYVYTWTTDRMWHMNLRINGDESLGVNLNRNWGYKWGGHGSSNRTRSINYRGTSPFSEPETQVVRDFILAHPTIEAHIDYHAYRQLVGSPWAYTSTLPPNHPEFNELNLLFVDAIASVHGSTYGHGLFNTTVVPASGAMTDWVFGAAGAKSWIIMLRPAEAAGGGYAPPPSEILSAAQENYEAVLQLGARLTAALKLSFETQRTGRIPSGEPYNFVVVVKENTGILAPGSGSLKFRAATSGPFDTSPLVSLGGDRFEATLPASDCGGMYQFYVEASSTGGQTIALPADGASAPVEMLVSDSVITFADDCEENTGWQVGFAGDTANRGIWNLMDPEATAAQPEDDHTPAPGTKCWVTDGRAGSSIGEFDIDNGITTLVAPPFDATEPWEIIDGEAYLTYSRWYSNNMDRNPTSDSMPVYISNNGGGTWKLLEDVKENAGQWVTRSFKIADVVTPTANMLVRFAPRDFPSDSNVEAAIDDIRLEFFGCLRHPADFNKDGALDIFDFLAFQNMFVLRDPRADLDQSTGVGVFDIFDFLEFQRLFVG